MKSLVLAVDFDGTVVEDRFPEIGKPLPFAIDTLKRLHADGHRIVLWTFRHGRPLRNAVEFLESQGVQLYAVNQSFPEESEQLDGYSRKIHADWFIDDRNIGGFLGWGVVYQQISQKPLPTEPKKKKWGLF
jgi:hydroxymethylpyrimidine pyrophosphatase-like HAD family hydrolase